MKAFFLVLFSLTGFTMTNAQQVIPLYEGAIPNSKEVKDEEKSETSDHILIISKISRPTLSIFLAPKEKANGTAVIVFPGGGYWVNAAGHEGIDVAKKMNEWGVTAFVLKYRIPDDHTMQDKEIGPLQDAQRAILSVREHAKEWNIDPGKIGIMGFSAGGHLASTAGTHFNKNVIDNPKHTSLRPDFMILVYPVISFRDSLGHIGSRDQLIGKNPSAEKIHEYSNEEQVTDQTPPSFLVHAADDDAVKVENSIRFFEALQEHKIQSELHIFPKGGHGFGMNNPTTPDQWMDRLHEWLRANHW